MDYTVITENDVSKWNDKAGIQYHFPNRYLKFLKSGTQIVYYKGRLTDKSYKTRRLSNNPHYFGIATIDKISTNNDGTANVSFKNFQLFSKPVPFKIEGNAIESIPTSRQTNYWRDGVRPINETIYNRILSLAEISHDKHISVYNDAEQTTTAPAYLEGGKKIIEVARYERNKELRDKAIEIHGYSCAACGFNFGEIYGEWGIGFIHIHHLHPVSQNVDKVEVDPKTDLVPLCANCHAMVHRRRDRMLSIAELVKMREI